MNSDKTRSGSDRQDPQKQLKRGKGDTEKDTGHTGAAGSEGN